MFFCSATAGTWGSQLNSTYSDNLLFDCIISSAINCINDCKIGYFIFQSLGLIPALPSWAVFLNSFDQVILQCSSWLFLMPLTTFFHLRKEQGWWVIVTQSWAKFQPWNLITGTDYHSQTTWAVHVRFRISASSPDEITVSFNQDWHMLWDFWQAEDLQLINYV